MTAQQLKNSILQMAVQGKLVPQDPNDEPASVLLERIRAEKERLIKEKKIKREKNPSVIFKGADNTPYEKIGDEVRSLADEVPFDIPDSWEWVRLGTVIELQSGQDMTPDKYNDCGKGIPYITGASNIENGILLINRWTEYGRAFAYCGDILLTCKGTVGTMAVLQEPQVHIARQIMAIRPISELYVPYIQLVLDTLVENLKAAAKSMIPGIAREDVLQSLFPVPPVSEQKRIVQKVSDLSPCLEQYAAADTKLLSLNTAFPERLKKSILQEAVQGKLVPQDPSDEPAEALLERIRSEKQRLIKEGKIKKDKHESVIFRRDNSHYEKLDGVERCIDDELPFEIPDSWGWVRLGTVFQHNTGKALNASNRDGEKLTYITTSNLYWDRFVLDNLKTMPFTNSEVDKCTVQQGDLLVCEGGDIGRAAIWGSNKPMRIQNHIHRLRAYVPVCTRFFYYLFYLYKGAGWIGGKGIAIQGLSSNAIHNLLFPLPRTGTHCQRHRYSTRYSAEIVKQPGIRQRKRMPGFFYQSITSSTIARCSVEVLRR